MLSKTNLPRKSASAPILPAPSAMAISDNGLGTSRKAKFDGASAAIAFGLAVSNAPRTNSESHFMTAAFPPLGAGAQRVEGLCRQELPASERLSACRQ